jgi:RNA polymerase sigma factor (sigma-70 family)
MLPDTPDATLLRAYAETRTEAAFGELVRRHLDGVYSAALRRVGGDAHLAQDVAQQVFVALARQAPRLLQHEYLVGWLYATTRNIAANAARLERRRKLREQEAYAMEQQCRDERPGSDWSRISPVLDGAIDEMREADRRALLLRFIERKTFAAVGQSIGASENAARMRVERALEKLRRTLLRHGITSTAGALEIILTQNAVRAAPAGMTSVIVAAGPAPTAVSTVGTLFSMSALKTVGVVAATAVLIVSVVSSVNARADRRRGEQAIVDAEAAQLRLAARLRAIEAEVAAIELQAASRRREIEVAAAARAAASRAGLVMAVGELGDPEWDAGAAGKAFLARHPDVKAAFVAWLNAEVDADYGALYPSLHLTPEKLDEFRALMRSGHSLGPSVGYGEKPLWLEADERLAGKERERRLHELLGPNYHPFWLYRPTIAARQFVGGVASHLTFSEEPLSAAQAGQLQDVLIANRVAPHSDSAKIDWDAARAQATGVLTSTQLRAFDALRAQKQADEAMNERTAKSSAKQ